MVLLFLNHIKELYPGLPWWSSGMNLLASAGDKGLNLGPHALEQLSAWATITEPESSRALRPQLLRGHAANTESPPLRACAAQQEKPRAHAQYEQYPPLTTTRENRGTAIKTQLNQK